MSPFEITMLVCFGASWPFSIHRVWRAKCATGKSIVFLSLILIGYLAGVLHKVCYSPDPVVGLYELNAATGIMTKGAGLGRGRSPAFDRCIEARAAVLSALGSGPRQPSRGPT
jgi:hypothetical protein